MNAFVPRWMQSSTTAQHNTADGEDSGQATPTADHLASGLLRQIGLSNHGNTCYANSVLQALYFCEPFRLAVQEGRQPPINLHAAATGLVDHAPPPVPVVIAPEPGTSKARPVSADVSRAKGGAGVSAGRAGLANALSIHRRTSSSGSVTGTGEAGESAKSTGSSPPGPAALATQSEQSPDDDTLLSTLRDLFCSISFHAKRNGVVAPHAFINQLRKENELFRSTMHQDAHEFLGYLLNAIVEEVELSHKPQEGLAPSSPLTSSNASSSFPSPSTANWIHSLFEGVLTNETRCLTCESVTSRDESFLDLSIDIEENTSVSACLRQFSASEMLAQKNKYSCDTCCGLQEAERRMRLRKLPRVLALHLKRFKYQEDLQRFTKLSHRVAFPLELRLFNTIPTAQPDPDQLYSLWAVVVHIGVGPHSGHYVTILRSGGRWLMFDDETVSEVSETDLNKYFGDTPGQGCGYVLFYEAVSADRPDRSLTHLAHDLTPAQLAALPRPTQLVPLYDPSEDERRPGSPTGSSAPPFSERDMTQPSPNVPTVALPASSEPSPQLATSAPSKEGTAGIKGFFGMGRKSGGGGAAGASDDGSTSQPMAPDSPSATRRPSLAPISAVGASSGGSEAPLTPVDNSDAASSTSSSAPYPLASPTSSNSKGLFGRAFLGRPKSMRRPVSTSGLSSAEDTSALEASTTITATTTITKDSPSAGKKQKEGSGGSGGKENASGGKRRLFGSRS